MKKIHRFLKKSNGAISLFMAVIMLANFVLCAVMVEGSRLRQAEAIVQSAADSAAMSVLAKYDKGLYNRYGLFVMDSEVQSEIQDDYINFFMSDLSAALPSEDLLNSLFTQLERRYGLKKSGADTLFDMYDFQADEVKVDPVYSIGSPQMLQLQTTEVAKYRSVFMLLQEVTGMGDKIAEEAVQQQKDVTLMQQSLKYREESQNVANELAKFSNALYLFYDGEGQPQGKRLQDEYNAKINDINNNYNRVRNAFNNVVNKYDAVSDAISAYNVEAGNIADMERQLQEKKESIQFDKDEEDYVEDDVKNWIKECEEVDKRIPGLEGKINNINSAISQYNSAINELNSANSSFKSSIDNLNSMLEGWSSNLSGYITRFRNLVGEIDRALSETSSHKTSIDSSGASDSVKSSARSDAETVEKSLTEAKNSNADGKLQVTKNYVDDLITKTVEFNNVYGALEFNTSIISIRYENESGTISAIRSAFESSKSSGTSKSTEPPEERPDWGFLSRINTLSDSDKPEVKPSDAFTGYESKFSRLKTPDGKTPFHSGVTEHYVYKTGIEYSSKVGDPSSSSSGAGKLKALYKSGVGSKTDDDSAEPNLEIPEDYFKNSLPSKHPEKFAINDKFKSEDEVYKNYVKDKYGSDVSVDPGSASGLDPGDSSTLSGFSGMSIGEDSSSQSKALGNINSFMGKVSNFFTHAQYDIMTYTYAMSMFKNRLTKSPAEYWKPKYSGLDRSGDFFVPRDEEDADLNLMLDHMAATGEDELKTQLNCEIEYILRGDRTDKQNRNEVWAIIYGIRLGNNLIAVYSNDEIREAASAAANAIAAAAASVSFGLGGLLAPLIQFAIIAVVAALETYMDLNFLVKDGYKVPFIKTSENLNISLDNLEDGDVSTPNMKNTAVKVKYEDYLLIFMLFTKQEDILFRMADLIQMNMNLETGEDYNLENRFTYIRCSNSVSIKPLMISYAFMPDDMRRNDRRIFKTLVYQGY